MSVNGMGNLEAMYAPQTQTQNLGSDQVKREDFLRLLVAQLQHQDPLNPVENQEFVAELATFSSLEQQTNQTKLLEQLVDADKSNYTSQALSMLGKDVVVAQNKFIHQPGQETEFVFQSPRAGEVMVQVTSESGNVVYTDTALAAQPGQNTYTFNGENGIGQSLPPGMYTITFGGSMDNQGNLSEYPAFLKGEVEGVSFMDGVPMLNVNNQPVPFTAVQAVMERGDTE